MAKNSAETIYVVALDDGYAAVKGIGLDPKGSGKLLRFRTPSNVTSDGLISMDGSGGRNSYSTYSDDVQTDVELCVTDTVVGQASNIKGFHFSPMNRVLVNHALLVQGYGGKKVKIWASLPVSDFYDQKGHRRDENIEKKKEALMKKVKSLSGEEMPEIVGVEILPQAVTTIFNELTNEYGEPREERANDTAFLVIDIGGRTTDFAFMLRDPEREELLYRPEMSFSIDAGVLNVKEELSALIREKYGIDDEFTPKVLDEAVRMKKVRLGSRHHEIADLCHEATRKTAMKIIGAMNQKIKNVSSIHCMFLSGGGASLFEKDLKAQYPDLQTLKNPEWVNVEGIHKLARIQEDSVNQASSAE